MSTCTILTYTCHYTWIEDMTWQAMWCILGGSQSHTISFDGWKLVLLQIHPSLKDLSGPQDLPIYVLQIAENGSAENRGGGGACWAQDCFAYWVSCRGGLAHCANEMLLKQGWHGVLSTGTLQKLRIVKVILKIPLLTAWLQLLGDNKLSARFRW